MRSSGLHAVFKKAVVALACAGALATAGALLGDDFEDPINPHSVVGDSVVAFGGTQVVPTDVGGALIDAKETIEPQMSVLLLTGTVNVSPGMTVEVQTSPTFDSWVSGGTS